MNNCGQVEERLEAAPEPLSLPDADALAIEADEAVAIDESVTFELAGVAIEGATVYGAETFRPLYESKIGAQASFGDMLAVARAITTAYRNDGYVLARAFVPGQRVDDGIVRIRVVEGYVDSVIVDAGDEPRSDLIALYAEAVLASRPLRGAVLERAMLLINDLPGVEATSVVRPSPSAPGAATLFVLVDRTPFEASAGVDNRGTRFNGAIQMSAALTGNSLVGRFDRTTLRGVTASQTEELRLVSLSHDEPIGSEGTRIGVSGTISRQEPGFTLEVLGINSSSESFVIQATHPLIRTRRENLILRGVFDFRNSLTDQRGARLSKDRVRSIRAGATHDFADRLRGVNLIDFEASQGLDVLGSRDSGSVALSRVGGRNDYTKAAFFASRRQGLFAGFGVEIAAAGQFAFSQLLASEEFTFGGTRFGRAYDPSEITGDHGLAAKIELQFNNETTVPLLRRYQTYAYYDIGSVWRLDDVNRESQLSAAAVGGGVRVQFTDWLSGSAEIGAPLTLPVAARGANGNDLRGFFSLSAVF